jgi:hypothetical protein
MLILPGSAVRGVTSESVILELKYVGLPYAVSEE